MSNHFRDKLEKTNDFVYSLEMVPGRGLEEKDLAGLAKEATEAAESGLIDILSFTDNPGGNTRVSPDYISHLIKPALRPSLLIHVTCKDMNRAWMESRLFQLEKMGAENVLCLTGDYPVAGYLGTPKPVFDMDSVSMLRLITEMNKGLGIPGKKPGTQANLTPTHFFPGACVSMFKRDKAELWMQYAKLEEKVRNGAQFIYTQLGYNARKFDELVRYAEKKGIRTPLIGNVFVLHPAVSRMMNQNMLPGCVVPDKLLEQVKKWATEPDKGKAKFLDFAAKQVAVFRGLGYRGVHLGGFGVKFAEYVQIIKESEKMASQWKDFVPELTFEQDNEYYLFKKDVQTSMNTPVWNDDSKKKSGKSAGYTAFKILHSVMFSEKSPLFQLNIAFSKFLSGRPKAESAFDAVEETIKYFTNHCRNCGDCALHHTAYICPENECAKYLRNGPCGGSYLGKCEVFKDKDCFWVRIYRRKEAFGEFDNCLKTQLPPRNWDLYQTPSWVNFFTGKDHQKLNSNPPAQKE